jgi:hypothetical protein
MRVILMLVTLVTILTNPLTAHASPTTAAGTASAGSADITSDGHFYLVPDVGACTLPNTAHGTSPGASQAGIVDYGPADATCTTDQAAHTSKSVANGANFVLSALQPYGGPQIKIANYQVTCTATTSGTNAAWQFSGWTGLTLPDQVPNNYTIPVKTTSGQLLANVIVSEVILPNPNDGSITLNMVHIILFPNGTPAGTPPMSGDIYVGTTACSPTV